MTRFVSLTAALVLTAVVLYGQIEGPYELPAEFEGKMFRQEKVGDCSLPLPGAPVAARRARHFLKAGDIGIRSMPLARLRVEGTDSGGKPWSFSVPNQPTGCSVWRADLDGNGQDDLILITSDATSGADVEVTLVMIDKEKRPVPWQAFGYFDGDHETGLNNLVDLNGDGRAELLYLHVEGERSEAGATSLAVYTVADARWRRYSGVIAGVSFPVRTPKGARPMEEPDLSNQVGTGGGRIASLVPGNPENCGVQLPIQRDGREIRIDAEATKAVGQSCFDRMVIAGGKPVRIPAIVVMDGRNGRVIAMEPSEQSRVLSEIKSLGLTVRLAGRSCDSGCRPFLLWAAQAR